MHSDCNCKLNINMSLLLIYYVCMLPYIADIININMTSVHVKKLYFFANTTKFLGEVSGSKIGMRWEETPAIYKYNNVSFISKHVIIYMCVYLKKFTQNNVNMSAKATFQSTIQLIKYRPCSWRYSCLSNKMSDSTAGLRERRRL